MPQDPQVRQDPKPKSKPPVLDEKQKKEMQKMLSGILKDSVLFGGGGKRKTSNEALSEAVDAAREQEKHATNELAARQKLNLDERTMRLKEDSEEHRREMAVAKGQADGVIPVNVGGPFGGFSSTPSKPAIGTGPYGGLLTEVPLSNDPAVAIWQQRRKQQVQEQGERSLAVSQMDKEMEHLGDVLDRIGKEKHLAYTQTGGIGRLLGSVLNLGSNILTFGNYNLGTELLGGTAPPSAQARSISSAISRVSPLIRSEMNYAIQQDRVDMTAKQRLGLAGLNTNLSALTKGNSARDADLIMSTAIDAKIAGEDAVKEDLDATGIGSMISLYETQQQLLGSMAVDPDVGSVDSSVENFQQAEEGMRQLIRDYGENGGTEQTLRETIAKMSGAIDSKFVASDFVPPPNEPAHAAQSRHTQKVVANEMILGLEGFADTAIRMLNEERFNISGRRFGVRHERVRRELDKGISDIRGTVLKVDPTTTGIFTGEIERNFPVTPDDIAGMSVILQRSGDNPRELAKMKEQLFKSLLRLRTPDKGKLKTLLKNSVKGVSGEDVKVKAIDEVFAGVAKWRKAFSEFRAASRRGGFGPK